MAVLSPQDQKEPQQYAADPFVKSSIKRSRHELVDTHNISSPSVGDDPNTHIPRSVNPKAHLLQEISASSATREESAS